jgi:uncharacterized phage-like protein YoqJ
MKIAVTGHRHQRLLGKEDLVQASMSDFLDMFRLRPTLISGLALGVDTIWAQVGLARNYDVIAAVPFLDQPSKWSTANQIIYREIIDRCKEVKVVCEGSYSPEKYIIRDRWMVDQCDLLVGYWDGTEGGGTYETIKYAEQVGKQHVIYRVDEL